MSSTPGHPRDESYLFQRTPVAGTQPSRAPVVVVGLPRSGSTYLSHLITLLDDWFVFDDLYIYRRAHALGASGPLSHEQLEQLVDFLGWQVRARVRHEKNYLQMDLSWEDVDRMCEAVLVALRGRRVEWWELLEEWMLRLALHHGKRRWGYKAPQDFMHMENLARAFPGIRFVFLVRDPRAVMASFKYLDGEDGQRSQYHPLVYARYWRLAAEMVPATANRLGLALHEVRYEDLVASPRVELERIAGFLTSRLSGEIPQLGANTSFTNGARRTLTDSEIWICQRIAGSAMRRLGYDTVPARPRLGDLPDLLATSLRFAAYQGGRLRRNRAARHSVQRFLEQVRANR